MKKRVYALDLGKKSMGVCVREDHKLFIDSLTIPQSFANTTLYKSRKVSKRLRESHKGRENNLKNLWEKAGLDEISEQDSNFVREFPAKGDNTVYTSCLLRIALLQNKQLEKWQIYKALFSSIQRRGYDDDLPWINSQNSSKTKDDEENEKYLSHYQNQLQEMIPDEKYHYPCYFDAALMGLWSYEKPEDFKLRINHQTEKPRSQGFVAPRKLVEKEITELFENAKKQILELNKISTAEFLYGESQEVYSTYNNGKYRRYLGKENKLVQGVLSQKIPRFNNRIIAKCRLMPLRNVCKANSIENAEFVLLMGLKNFRYRNLLGEKQSLTPEQIKKILENKNNDKKGTVSQKLKDNKKVSITKKDIHDVLKEEKINYEIKEIDPPIEVKTSGRASYCRPTLKILKELILSGKAPADFDAAPVIKINEDETRPEKGITHTEISTMLARLGNSWENIHIGDDRNLIQLDENFNKEIEIIRTIGKIPNPVVRHRIQWFYNELKKLSEKHGAPDEVIIEFIRDSENDALYGVQKTKSYIDLISKNKKENEKIKEELQTAGLSEKNSEKLKLLKLQGGNCIYTNEKISINQLEHCEVDHIVPVSKGGNDALYNKVLCKSSANQDKKERIPYNWLKREKDDKFWIEYVDRINSLKNSLGGKKVELLTSENPFELIESYNALAETAYIARIAQKITALHFGWGLGAKDEKQRVFVSNGRETAKIRRIYGLNSLLYDENAKPEDLKNRSNPKHHALDAICISYSRELKPYKKDNGEIRWKIDGFDKNYIKQKIDELIPVTVRRDKSELQPLETIYGKRERTINGKKIYCLTQKVKVDELKTKDIKNILDEDVKANLELKAIKSDSELKKILENYYHPKKQSRVKRLRLIVSTSDEIQVDETGRERIGEYADFADFKNKKIKGQFKHTKQHGGFIIYFDEKEKPKAMAIYAHQSEKKTKADLKEQRLKLYNKGELYYSGCYVKFSDNFETGKDKTLRKPGIYKLKTIMGGVTVKLESLNGEIFTAGIKIVVDAKMRLYKPKR